MQADWAKIQDKSRILVQLDFLVTRQERLASLHLVVMLDVGTAAAEGRDQAICSIQRKAGVRKGARRGGKDMIGVLRAYQCKDQGQDHT